MGIAIVFVVIAIVMCLWSAISPAHAWEKTTAWRYQDPEAHRPSDTQFTVTRVVCIIVIPILIAMIPLLLSLSDANREEAERDSYRDCLLENQDSDGLLSAEDWCENLSPAN
ncbi:hypothetical protein [Cumulibacter soli]|uniref:hypothetical protein n=1 Tax=Cumulibacter soli TaxID=2546344 RepID=UPI001068BE27|nr:hypothetical protein [Cumulibacter soli]